MTTRRGFLSAALAAFAAPAYVKAGILMPVKKVWAPTWIGVDHGTDYGADAWGMVRWTEVGADGVPVFRLRLISRDEAMWTPYELDAIRSRPAPPLVFNQISAARGRVLTPAEL